MNGNIVLHSTDNAASFVVQDSIRHTYSRVYCFTKYIGNEVEDLTTVSLCSFQVILRYNRERRLIDENEISVKNILFERVYGLPSLETAISVKTFTVNANVNLTQLLRKHQTVSKSRPIRKSQAQMPKHKSFKVTAMSGSDVSGRVVPVIQMQSETCDHCSGDGTFRIWICMNDYTPPPFAMDHFE